MSNEDKLAKIPIITTILGSINAIGGLITVFTWVVCLSEYMTNNNMLFIVIPSIITTIFIGIVIICWLKRKQWQLRLLAWIMGLTSTDEYKVKESIGVYEYITRTEMKLTREYHHVNIIRGIFTGLPVQYKWTGADKVEPTCTETGQRLELRDEDYLDGQQHYYLKFDGNQKRVKGVNIPKMGYKIENMHDEKMIALPYFSRTIAIPTNKLILEVIFNRDLQIKNIRKLTYIHSSDPDHFFEESVEQLEKLDDERNHIKWTIDHPIYGGKYSIRWDFK